MSVDWALSTNKTGFNQAGPSPIASQAEQAMQAKPSNQRFRSFAERWIVTRSEGFRKDPDGMAEDTWNCILDAKRAYAMIKQVGRGVDDTDG